MSKTTTTRPPARLVIVDDHPAVREALILRLARHPDLTVVGEADECAAALKLIARTQPDLVILDIGLKGGNGLDLLKRLRQRGDTVRVLVWSMYQETLYAERALRAGAFGYITKERATEDLVAAIRQVLAGKVYLSPAMTEVLLARTVRGTATDANPETLLSDRELEVFRLLGQGLATRAIAERMKLSPKTVETYRERIKEKLGVSTTPELLRRAIRWVDSASSS
jgi:DNA-binding NarL/FixJ family response regulator